MSKSEVEDVPGGAAFLREDLPSIGSERFRWITRFLDSPEVFASIRMPHVEDDVGFRWNEHLPAIGRFDPGINRRLPWKKVERRSQPQRLFQSQFQRHRLF